MNLAAPLVFDGHNDVLLKLHMAGGVSAAETFLTGRDGHIDVPKSIAGGFGGGFFAIYVPSEGDLDFKLREMAKPEYDLPLPAQIDIADALPVALSQASILNRLEGLGALKICTSTEQISNCLAGNRMAAIMHMEGAEAIDPDFHALDVFYRAGLRSLGPVWSRPTIYGYGVPFRYPSTGDTGPGLTEHGLRLVERCNAMGVMIDLSHLTEAGFWDVARVSTKPLVATHSNCYEICRNSRNLTDRQLSAIAESDGMVGLNFAAAFLREDGQMKTDVPLDQMLRHLDHLMENLGEDRVGFGSDFDGAKVPDTISSAAGLPNLREAIRGHGYDDCLMKKLCHENWLRVLDKTWNA
jgi:membrane dipeptidase